ncbi:NAC domain-containing protein 83-like [Actinidia eriantha]|uniref:NAC domain-containing protein 83-like n=1 Tax=Actinidia eriantha TaxID=165200 RepID=UPI0025843427|nr:NAC domain-containing protein 83-like [Actinidia eriantha]XP_057493869.1 NAC domain-containing protein 83-like [Actinidia eriantha]
MAFMVPYGFRFNPKDQEIIYLLLKKANGSRLPVDEGLIQECDLFGKEEPWEIFGQGMEKTRYFFTRLKKKSKRNGCNFVRTAGKGTWKGQDGRGCNPITDHKGSIIGFKKNLVYKGKGTDTNGRWLMKEYHLDGVSLEPQPKFNDYVLCRIRKKDDGRKQEKQTDKPIIHQVANVGFKAKASSTMESNIPCLIDYELPNLSVPADAARMESIARDWMTKYSYFNSKESRIDRGGDQRIARLGTENCVPEGVSTRFTQDDEAEFWRDFAPILKSFSDEGFGGRLWTESGQSR